MRGSAAPIPRLSPGGASVGDVEAAFATIRNGDPGSDGGAYYDRTFLSRWEAADPGLTRLREAQAAVERLGD